MPTPCHLKARYGADVTTDPIDPTDTVEIPLTGKYRLSSNIVYADDEEQYMYTEHTLYVETVLYSQNQDLSLDNIEEECERIRNILSTPGQQLLIHPIGLGEIDSINVNQPDAKGGPYPQTVEVEPIASNNAILIQWVVMFRTYASQCADPFDSTLLQYTVEQDFDVDDAGNMQFTVNITYQSRNAITAPDTYVDITNILVPRVGKSFQGMRKRKRTSLSRDQRIMSIRLVYSEIESDNAFFPYTQNIKVRDSVESSLLGKSALDGKGFYTWKRTINGKVSLPARVHKAWAWVVIVKILRERFKKIYPFDKIGAIFDVKAPTNLQNNEDSVKTEPWYLPLSIRIENDIYSRDLSFNVNYVVVSDLRNLLNNTKLLARVNTGWDGAENVSDPKTLSEQWIDWQVSKDINLSGIFRYEMEGTPIVYSQCDNTYSDHRLGANALLCYEEDPDHDEGEGPSSQEDSCDGGQTGSTTQVYDATYPEAKFDEAAQRDEKYTWIKFDNDFEVIEDGNIVEVAYLEEPTAGFYDTADTSSELQKTGRGYAGMSMHGKANSAYTQNYPPETIERGYSTFYIRMKGQALRLNHKIPIPFVIGIDQGGSIKKAKRLKSSVKQKQIQAGDYPMYMAQWDIVYHIDGTEIITTNDLLADVVSTGSPGHYV